MDESARIFPCVSAAAQGSLPTELWFSTAVGLMLLALKNIFFKLPFSDRMLCGRAWGIPTLVTCPALMSVTFC